jgi:hypothetical protein
MSCGKLRNVRTGVGSPLPQSQRTPGTLGSASAFKRARPIGLAAKVEPIAKAIAKAMPRTKAMMIEPRKKRRLTEIGGKRLRNSDRRESGGECRARHGRSLCLLGNLLDQSKEEVGHRLFDPERFQLEAP